MRRDHIGANSASSTSTTITTRPGDRAGIGAEIAPELAQRMRRRAGLRRDDGGFEDFGGHRVCRMRGLIRP